MGSKPCCAKFATHSAKSVVRSLQLRTVTIVYWVGVFTRRQYKDIMIESLRTAKKISFPCALGSLLKEIYTVSVQSCTKER